MFIFNQIEIPRIEKKRLADLNFKGNNASNLVYKKAITGNWYSEQKIVYKDLVFNIYNFQWGTNIERIYNVDSTEDFSLSNSAFLIALSRITHMAYVPVRRHLVKYELNKKIVKETDFKSLIDIFNNLILLDNID